MTQTSRLEVPVSQVYTFLVCSVRYSLGRMSYIVSDIADLCLQYGKYLEPSQRDIIKRDISEALKEAESREDFCGMEMDHRTWMRCLSGLEALGDQKALEIPQKDTEAKVYNRSLSGLMVRSLGDLYRKGGVSEFIHIPTLFLGVVRCGDFCKLRYWGLIEGEDSVRDDGNPRNGYWRVTPKGENFLQGKIKIPKVARVQKGECIGFSGPEMLSSDLSGETFNYSEIF